ncbi:MAG: nucleoside deaminase [Breznakibacter sp.]
MDDNLMKKAVALSLQNIEEGGGPFGAVVVKGEEIVGVGINRVTANNDPTAHAEVMAIRDAAARLERFDLSDCVIYTSCEPCPMCLGAIYWARIKKVYYGNTKQDAARIGFDDGFIYEELAKPLHERSVSFVQLLPDEAAKAFKLWEQKADKRQY